MKKKKKFALIASAGGHLTELLELKKAWNDFECFFVSDSRINALELSEKEKVYFVKVPRRNPLNFLINFFQALKIYLKEKPSIVISTGADVAFAFLLIAKIFGSKIVFIESFAQVFSPSLTGKLVYFFSNRFYIQWPELKKFFPKAVYKGKVF